ncbi:MAG TPA: RsmG family class I SAM-dependent methyltransferase [Polyangiaceae bacterium]|jgi:16S rRNA (guanine527-N7)-methyltransferase
MAAKLAARVEAVASALGSTLEGQALAHIGTWLERLEEWNARIDLTAARSPDELVDLMLADALFLAPRVPRDARLVDVGTGAGAPGLALALLRPDLRVTLVEPLGKRAAFLRTVLGEAGRADVVIERVRGQAVAGRRAWDVAVSRATLKPGEWLDLAVTLAAPGGSVWSLLAKEEPSSHARATIEEDASYVWPLTGAARRAVRYLVVS